MYIRAIEIIQTQGKVDKISIGDVFILNVGDLKLKFEFRKLLKKRLVSKTICPVQVKTFLKTFLQVATAGYDLFIASQSTLCSFMSKSLSVIRSNFVDHREQRLSPV